MNKFTDKYIIHPSILYILLSFFQGHWEILINTDKY